MLLIDSMELTLRKDIFPYPIFSPTLKGYSGQNINARGVVEDGSLEMFHCMISFDLRMKTMKS